MRVIKCQTIATRQTRCELPSTCSRRPSILDSLESSNEGKTACRRGVSIGQATSYQACWKLFAQIVRALEDSMLGSMCQ
jgi:hypothetical protein